ncbi:putative HAT dimerization domain, ribonuclease H-like superfamily [Plasmopara halstedii]
MEGINPAYRIPSRNTIKARILELMESTNLRMKARIAEEKSKGVFFSFTLDFWTSVNNKPYVAVTIHSVSSGWSFENFLLAFREVPHPHTAAEVASCIVEIPREFGLLDCAVSFTTDNADNMVNGMILMLFGKVAAVHLRCAAHCLNLIVQAGLAVAKGSIDAIRNFVNFVRRSSKQRQQLNAITRTVNEEAEHAGAKLQLVTIDLSAEVDTPWNSCYTMLQSAIKLKVQIALYQVKHRAENYGYPLLTSDFENAKALSKFLAPFEKITTAMSAASNPSLRMLVTFFQFAKKHIDSTLAETDNAAVKSAAQAMQTKFATYYGYRLKNVPDADHARIVAKICSDSIALEGNSQASRESVAKPPMSFEEELHRADVQAAAAPVTIQQQLDVYLKMENESFSVDVLQWWKVHERQFPAHATIARLYLTMIGTSVPAECIFSDAGEIITKKQSRLGVDVSEACQVTKRFKRFEKNERCIDVAKEVESEEADNSTRTDIELVVEVE